MAQQTTANGVLRRLGIVGVDALEPIVLAALATESPLLLIGPHGTAKSFLLGRLSEALGLSWRHYNASLISYDDLVGYPLPDDHGSLRFIETPASIWGAEAVFLDEISRCRVDMQNRLFPIVHERKVQGMPLSDLRHRWAAMNPPSDPDDHDAMGAYAGSEPLDVALADRFPFIVSMPCFTELSPDDQRAVVHATDESVATEDGALLRAQLEETRARMAPIRSGYGELLGDYARMFVVRILEGGVALSGRRATMIFRNLVAVHAAASARGETDLSEITWRTVSSSLPLVACGLPCPLPHLVAVHREIWRAVASRHHDSRRLLVAEPDPVRRALLAIDLEELDAATRSSYVADALASLPPGGRHALAHHVCSRKSLDLNPAVAEQVAELEAQLVIEIEIAQQVAVGGPAHVTSQRITDVLSIARPAPGKRPHPDRDLLANLLPALFEAGMLVLPGDVDEVTDSWIRMRMRLGALQPGEELLLS